MSRRSRILVAMSGGVDSAVAAGLLVEAGYEVVGVTLQLYDHGAASGRKGACCAGRDIEDARAAAAHLGIAHYVLDFEERFRRAVIDDFADAYARGITPVPCIRCNQRIKFGELMEVARELGAEALATGHYARIEAGPEGPELHKALDESKDQSYFLFATTLEQLGFLRFPLGHRRKHETRAEAQRLGLLLADKAESQDICFVPKGHYTDLVGRLRPDALVPGEIVHVDGRRLGGHAGTGRYTVGQRRGLGVAAAEPLYVTAVEPSTRRVTVGPRDAARSAGVVLAEASWLAAPAPDTPLMARHRHKGEAAPAFRTATDRVAFAHPQAGVAPGQACVLYDGSRVVGGGWIVRGEPATPRPPTVPALDSKGSAA